MKSSSACAGCGVVPRPPARNTLKPGSSEPSARGRVTAMMPTSLNIAWPQSVAQPEKLTLNLRGRRCAIGLRRNRSVTAWAHGVMSSTSNGQAPARWQPATLRTVSPHASRLVRPTEPSRRSTSGTSRSCDEVELHVLAGGEVAPARGSRLVAIVAEHLELLRRDPAVGDLHPHHLVGAALALAVDALVQAHHPEDVLGDVAREVLLDRGLELVDLVGHLGVEGPGSAARRG